MTPRLTTDDSDGPDCSIVGHELTGGEGAEVGSPCMDTGDLARDPAEEFLTQNSGGCGAGVCLTRRSFGASVRTRRVLRSARVRMHLRV
jgi:hypothetical protein